MMADKTKTCKNCKYFQEEPDDPESWDGPFCLKHYCEVWYPKTEKCDWWESK